MDIFLTVIIPCYNEKLTIEKLISKILKIKNIKKQIIIVDDYSSDGTRELIRKKLSTRVDKVIYHNKNMGKGASIKSASKYILGNIVIIQDADLEYDPKDYYKLIKPISNNEYKVVYGSRVLDKSIFKELNDFSHWTRIVGNYFLTKFSNFLNRQKLTDAHTCYKVFEAKLFKKILIKENNFNFCPEITTKLANLKCKIIEVPISYSGRSYKNGKKISSIDGLRALKTIIKYKFVDKKNLKTEL
jgi:dolichol-phosphate mannosyltransferase